MSKGEHERKGRQDVGQTTDLPWPLTRIAGWFGKTCLAAISVRGHISFGSNSGRYLCAVRQRPSSCSPLSPFSRATLRDAKASVQVVSSFV